MLGHIESSSMYTYQVSPTSPPSPLTGLDENHPLTIPKIIFLACGFLTICLSVPVWLYLPDSPSQASFLTQHEKLIVAGRQQGSGSESDLSPKDWNWRHVSECLTDTKTWCWVTMHTALA